MTSGRPVGTREQWVGAMSHCVFLKGLAAFAATLAAAGMFIVHSGHGENSAMIYQSSPFGGDATVEVRQHDGVTIIERHGAGGNSTTIIQQR